MTQGIGAPAAPIPPPVSGLRTLGWLRYVVAFAVFAVVVYGGIAYVFSVEEATRSWALLAVVALGVAFGAYAGVEYWQTGALASISRQFDTRTIVLMPIAIALNIVLGQAVGAALKIPIYLDSIGTILVGALAGPIPGAITGIAANLIWTYVLPPPFHSDIAAAFAITAAVIGLLAGMFARIGWMRPRPNSSGATLIVGGLVALGLVLLMAWYAYDRFYGSQGLDLFSGTSDPLFQVLGVGIGLLGILAVVGFGVLLFARRDVTVAYVVVAGIATGIVSALISAPIAANLFSGVTGSGTDFLVAVFRQSGSDITTATFQQGLLSDPVDKLVTFLIVYLILTAMARRTKARYPQGEYLIERGPGGPLD
jgi:energy-coupling factor transport system substrate-specific component